MTGEVLQLRGVSKRFGGVCALNGIDLSVERGEIVALVGPNGAGKTTLFDVVSGLERQDLGRVLLQGRDVTAVPAHKRPDLGLARTFQTTQSFEALDVVENILVGRCRLHGPGLIRSGLRTRRVFRREHSDLVRAFEILELLGLYDKAGRRMNQISTLQRQLVSIGRGLAMEPSLLLLDEPFGGLNAEEASKVAAILESLSGPDLSLLVIDHQVDLLRRLADRLAVLRHGEMMAEGRPEEVLAREQVESILALGRDGAGAG